MIVGPVIRCAMADLPTTRSSPLPRRLGLVVLGAIGIYGESDDCDDVAAGMFAPSCLPPLIPISNWLRTHSIT